MPLIRQEEIYPVADTPWAQAIEAVATAAIVKNDIVIVDGVTGIIPKASPASSATLSESGGQLYVAAGKAAAGDKLYLLPSRSVSGVNTSGGNVGEPVYLSTGGDFALSPGVEPRIVGTILAADATAGKVLLAPGRFVSKAVSQTEVVDSKYFDDFFEFTGTTSSTTGWKVTEVHGDETQATQSEQFGVLLLTNKASTNENAQQIQWVEGFAKPTQGKRLWFEARINCNGGDATNLDFFVGLAATENLNAVGDNMPANGIGFHKDDGDTNIDFSTSDDNTHIQQAAVATLANDTYIRLGFSFDGGATGSGVLTPYVDGVAGTQITTMTYAVMAEISPIIMIRNGDGTTQQKIKIDYVQVISER